MKSKFTSWLMLVAFMGMTVLPAQAAMVSTGQVVGAQQSSLERETVTTMLERADVQAQLMAMGVSAQDVQLRVAAMTDAEVMQLNEKMADLPAGGGIVGLVALVFVIFVITDVIGATDIFPFIRPVN
ncbi:PA2779 family protein [Thiomicrospira microaerophila]|uniref:DUF6627 family protein n=1 Tax=Thiomicrospira microaerophila TaxID=406020 RepID=UPI00200BF25B|nr:DUF6627 family protein [Thiomicrospira microaerophila]UQB41961.1 PA2779 family protein [Thiomicrospira microaerophila]